MIILEGPNQSGKGTVAKALQSLLPGHTYVYSTRPPMGVSTFKYHGWKVQTSRPQVILDRLHWSELAYGQVFRRVPDYTQHQLRILELMLHAQWATVLLLLDDYNDYMKRMEGKVLHRPDHVIGSTDAEEIYERYLTLAEGTGEWRSTTPHVLHNARELVDFATGQPTAVLRDIARTESINCDITADYLVPTEGAGSLEPDFMIVGDTRGEKDRDDSPSCAWDTGFAAEWLWKPLDELGVPWWRGYYTNASAFANPLAFEQYWGRLCTPPILALGHEAHCLVKATRAAPYAHYLGHPSYMRRFQFNQYDDWRESIRQGLTCVLSATS